MLESPIRDINSKDEVADWIEFQSIANQRIFSKSDIGSYIERETDQYSERASEDKLTQFTDSIWLELKRRQKLYGKKTPFRIKGDLIQPVLNWSHNPLYQMCLILSRVGNGGKSSFGGKLFERACEKSIGDYLNAETCIFGHPSGVKLSDLVVKLNERPGLPLPKGSKDRKLDIIAWKSFGDGRSGEMTVLFQCASGHNWRTKTTELSRSIWHGHIHGPKHLARGLVVPVIVSNNDFHNCCDEAGIIIDRTRLYRFCRTGSLDRKLCSEIKKWNAALLSKLKRKKK